jgi:hypothetical protein
MSRIPPVTPPPPRPPVHHHARNKPQAPPVSLGGEPPFQGAPPKVGLGVNVKV